MCFNAWNLNVEIHLSPPARGFHSVCSASIFIPMHIRIIQPAASILFSKIFPSLLPKDAPGNDNANVIIPITTTGMVIENFRKTKLTPIANASILVAIASASRT